jgi:hypothetical protein
VRRARQARTGARQLRASGPAGQRARRPGPRTGPEPSAFSGPYPWGFRNKVRIFAELRRKGLLRLGQSDRSIRFSRVAIQTLRGNESLATPSGSCSSCPQFCGTLARWVGCEQDSKAFYPSVCRVRIQTASDGFRPQNGHASLPK